MNTEQKTPASVDRNPPFIPFIFVFTAAALNIWETTILLRLVSFVGSLRGQYHSPAYVPAVLINGFLVLAIFSLKIAVYAGIYGVLAGLVSGEEKLCRKENFKKNIVRFGQVYGVIVFSGILLRVLAIRFFNLYSADFRFALLPAMIDVFIVVVSAVFITGKRYGGLMGTAKCGRLDWRLARDAAAVLAAFGVINFFLGYQSRVIFECVMLAAAYLNFWLFCRVVETIISGCPEISRNFNKEKELYLISPPWGGPWAAAVNMVMRHYPPVFLVLKALTPKDYAVREFNSALWDSRYYAAGKLVAITCFSANSYFAYKIAKEFRKRGSTVVMGGPHVSYNPDEALEFCDSVVIGEVEDVWEGLVSDYERGQLKKQYRGAPGENFYQKVQERILEFPADQLANFVESTRGCKFNCEFCSIPYLSGRAIRHKPVEEVVRVLEKIKGSVKEVLFIDNNIFADPPYARKLFAAMKPLKIKWASAASADIAADPEDLKAARESGCKALLVGYEISQESAEALEGKFRLAKEYRELNQRMKRAGIAVRANFIMGFDSDSLRDLWQRVKLAFLMRPHLAAITLLTPFPGTPLFARLFHAGRLTNLNWRYYNVHHFVFDHPRLNGWFNKLLINSARVFVLAFGSRGGIFLLLLILAAVCWDLFTLSF